MLKHTDGRRASDRLGWPSNGMDYEKLLRQTMHRRGWITFHSREGDRRRKTDEIARRIGPRRHVNHLGLFMQVTIRRRDLDKVNATLECWEEIVKRSNPRAAWIFIELEDGSRHPRAMVESAVIAMEQGFIPSPPRRGFVYCLLADKDGHCRWKNPYHYRAELIARRASDMDKSARHTGAICSVNTRGITVRDILDGCRYFVFWNEILKPTDGLPRPPLSVGRQVTFVPDDRKAGRTPLARAAIVGRKDALAA